MTIGKLFASESLIISLTLLHRTNIIENNKKIAPVIFLLSRSSGNLQHEIIKTPQRHLAGIKRTEAKEALKHMKT